MDALDYHLQHPEIDLDTYMRVKRLRLGQEVVARTRIYLDTRFWVCLRDVSMGRARSALHTEMLDLLRQLVVAGRVVCPISYSVFTEVMASEDQILKTSRETARLRP